MSAPVIPPRPVINTDDLLEVMIPRGQPFEKIVRIENASKINVFGELIGLDHKKVEEGVLIFGTVPTDANFTIQGGIFRITALHPNGDVVGELPWRFP